MVLTVSTGEIPGVVSLRPRSPGSTVSSHHQNLTPNTSELGGDRNDLLSEGALSEVRKAQDQKEKMIFSRVRGVFTVYC